MFVDNEARHEAEVELEAGEVLLWFSRPDPKQVARQSLPLFIFAIPWTTFSVLWVVMASGMGATSHTPANNPVATFFPLFGIPFILIGLGMLTSPYWASLRAKLTVYAITNRRVFIVQGGSTRTVQSFLPAEIGSIQRVERPDGSGNLAFARQPYLDNQNRTQTTTVQFLGVPDVRAVEQLLRETFQELAGVDRNTARQ